LKRILIVKTSALGDIIHAFPVAGYLHQKFPDAQIDWVVELPFAGLVEAHPLVKKIFPIETKKWRRGKEWQTFWQVRKQLRQHTYDSVFDLQGNFKSASITLQAKALKKVGFGKKTVPEWPNLLVTNFKADPPVGRNIREDYLSLVQTYFEDTFPYDDKGIKLKITSEQSCKIQQILSHSSLKQGKKVMVCPGSSWPNKQMNQQALIDLLKCFNRDTPCCFLLIWGNEWERKIAQNVHAALKTPSVVIDKLPIPVLQNLMDQLDLVIAMDSLPLHLAGTTSTPTFSVFGASLSHKYRPFGVQHSSFQGSCPYKKTFEKRCPILRTCKTGACIRTLSGADVFTSYAL